MSLVCIHACLLWGVSNVRVSVSDIEMSDAMPSTHGRSPPSSGPTFNQALLVATNISADAETNGGFVYWRNGGKGGTSAVHILFDAQGSLMGEYFNQIKEELAKYAKTEGGNLGTKLKQAMDSKQITARSENQVIWEALIKSLEFSGVDFEHRYGLVAGGNPSTEWEYAFAESIVLTQTVLLVVTQQSYGPLSQGLKAVPALPAPQPLLVVGMIGDCVKAQSSFYKTLTKPQQEIVNSPIRLAHKMHAFTSSLLLAHQRSASYFPDGLSMDATVPGAGAFGGKLENLAPPFVDSITKKDLAWKTKDEVNLFIFNDNMKAVFDQDSYPYPSAPGKEVHTNIKIRSLPQWNEGFYTTGVGLGGVAQGRKKLRVVVAGFDPISLAPHTVVNRAQSLEAQLGHATDMMFRLTGKIGTHVPVLVTPGKAHKSGKDFFTKTGAIKLDGMYESVRYVQGVTGVQPGSKMLLVDKSADLRVWNGDRWDGWRVELPDWSGP